MKPVISVRNISKSYQIGLAAGPYDRGLRHTLSRALSAPFRRLAGRPAPRSETIWALKDVSFDVQQGEVLGIIGRNGAGKSTLLKILSRITPPAGGEIKLRGRVASLLEVGTGFHPELTGRENVFLNGSILGMTRAEVRTKFDEIVAFSEIEKFLDTPVKRYSSGMYVRLAFAVAAHLDPEILLVDEVLAVGDAQFQKKCIGKMESVAKTQGRTVLFVSHNMASIQKLCHLSIMLSKNRIAFSGPTANCVQHYLGILEPDPQYGDDGYVTLDATRDTHLSGKIFKKIRLLNNRQISSMNFPMLSEMRIDVQLDETEKFPKADYAVFIDTASGMRVTTFFSRWLEPKQTTVAPKRIQVNIHSLKLAPGAYRIGLIAVYHNVQYIDRVDDAVHFNVEPLDASGAGIEFPSGVGVMLPEGTFQLDP